jgi:hypothetical protein
MTLASKPAPRQRGEEPAEGDITTRRHFLSPAARLPWCLRGKP